MEVMMNIFCVRYKKLISESDCCQTIITTNNKELLNICIKCENGIRLAKLCPYYERWQLSNKMK